MRLTGIEALRRPQVIEWGCDGSEAAPMPAPRVLRNQWTSVWEFTVRGWSACDPGTIVVRGLVVGATSWRLSEETIAPECGKPSEGQAVYVAEGFRYYPFETTLTMFGQYRWRCPADWNDDGVLNSQDFFEYVNDFFEGMGEIDCQREVSSSADFFYFLSVFFSGCEC